MLCAFMLFHTRAFNKRLQRTNVTVTTDKTAASKICSLRWALYLLMRGAHHAKKLKMQLAAIDTAQVIDDVDLPGYQLHPLKGEREDIWSISVNGNWRVTFEFKDGNAFILNYEDYH